MHSLESIKQTIHSGEGQTIEFSTDNYTPQSRNKLINLIFKEAGLVEKMDLAYNVFLMLVKDMEAAMLA